MATILSPLYTARRDRNITLHSNPSYREVQAPVSKVRFQYTCLGTEAAADIIVLEAPRISGYLVPENSRVTNIGASDCDMDVKLQRVPTVGGTAEDLTTAASIDNNSVAFARPAAGVPALLRDDILQMVLSNVDAKTAGEVLLFELEVYGPESA